MNKKNLLLVVGAGASVEFGIPSVQGVDDILEQMANRIFPLEDKSQNEKPYPCNLYSFMKKKIENYMNLNVPEDLRPNINFESIFHAIISADGTRYQGMFTSTKAALLEICELPNVLLYGEKRENGLNHLHNLIEESHIKIIETMREKCENFKEMKDNKTYEKLYGPCQEPEECNKKLYKKYKDLCKFLRDLDENFNINVVTLNYDNLIYQAFKDIKPDHIITGFNEKGQFEEDLIFNGNPNHSKILHLHGSINFSRKDMSQGIKWKDDYLNDDLEERCSPITTMEGDSYPRSTIIAGYGKTSQILESPFRTYYSEFERMVSNSDCVLFAGYGFNDVHVNKAFDKYLDKKDNRRIVVIDFNNSKEMNSFGPGFNYKPRNVLCEKVQNIIGKDFSRSSYALSPTSVSYFFDEKKIQVDANGNSRFAIWYNGMIEACINKEQILENLK